LYQNKASQITKADLKDMFKEAAKSVCTSTVVVSPNLVSYAINFSYEDSKPAGKGDIQMDYSSD